MNKTQIETLHHRNVSLFEKHQTIEGELLDALQDFDRCRGYHHFGQNNFFSYCVEILKMTENQAYTFIRVSRKSVEVPKLKEAVQAKRISISSAKVIASVITQQNQQDWITKAESLSKSALEREITKVQPKALKADRIIPMTPQLSELRGVISVKAWEILKRIKELESKSNRSPCDLDRAIIVMGEFYLDRNDPVRKAQNKKSGPTSKSTVPGDSQKSISRKIPMATLHQLNRRDNGACQFVRPKGRLCGSRHYVEFHHIKPFSLGGQHSAQNLVTLCSGHHKGLHRRGKPNCL